MASGGLNTDPTIPGVSYHQSGNYMSITGGTDGVPESGVTYTHTADGTTVVNGISELETDDDSITIQSSHTANDEQFAGNFVCAYVDLGGPTAGTADDYKLLVYIPDELITDPSGYVSANVDRNKVLYDVVNTAGNTVINGPLSVTLINPNTGATVSNSQWRSNLAVLPEWQTSLVSAFGDGSHVVYKPIDDVPYGSGSSYIENSSVVKGYFNTTTHVATYSGSTPSVAETSWWTNASQQVKTQIQPLVSESNDMLLVDVDSAGDNSAVCGFQTQDGGYLYYNNGSMAAGQTEDEYDTYFALVNKMPLVWGDCVFAISEDTSIDSDSQWSTVAITDIDEQGNVVSGILSRAYYENKIAGTGNVDNFVWDDDSSDVRWFDGWGFDNGGSRGITIASVTGLNGDDVVQVQRTYSASYEGDNSQRIYVGNQQRVADADLTNTERSAISGKNFIINARVAATEEGTITADTVSVYVYTTLIS